MLCFSTGVGLVLRVLAPFQAEIRKVFKGNNRVSKGESPVQPEPLMPCIFQLETLPPPRTRMVDVRERKVHGCQTASPPSQRGLWPKVIVGDRWMMYSWAKRTSPSHKPEFSSNCGESHLYTSPNDAISIPRTARKGPSLGRMSARPSSHKYSPR
jgi:hypothetical protein